MSGTACFAVAPPGLISSRNTSIGVAVAVSALAIDSVDGQRARPSPVMRFDLLNVVGSSPARRASPEADSPARAARRSIADHTCAWVSMGHSAGGPAPHRECWVSPWIIGIYGLPAQGPGADKVRLRGSADGHLLILPCIPRVRLNLRDGADIAELEGAQVTTIYKICGQSAWREAESSGGFRGSEADARDGFIHFSTATQVAETAARHFANERDLVLVAVDA